MADPVIGFSKQAYIKILGCLKILKMVPGNLLVFGEYEHVSDM